MNYKTMEEDYSKTESLRSNTEIILPGATSALVLVWVALCVDSMLFSMIVPIVPLALVFIIALKFPL